MDGGATRKRRVTPPMEKPMSCVDMTRSQASDCGRRKHKRPRSGGKIHATEAKFLMIIYALHGDDICRIGSRGTDTGHNGNEYL